MDRSGQGRSPVPHRRTTSVRRTPRYRERAERRVDRRDRDDRAPAGACVASAAGVRGPRAAARRSATPRRVDPSRPRAPLRSGALHRRAARLGGARREQPLRAARRRGRAAEPAHSAGGLVRRRLVRAWPRTAPARPERARGVLVRGGHEAAAGQLDLPAAGLDAGRSGSRALLRDGLADRGQAAGRGDLLPAARALTSPAGYSDASAAKREFLARGARGASPCKSPNRILRSGSRTTGPNGGGALTCLGGMTTIASA